MKKADLYIISEIASPFSIAFLVVAVIIILSRMFDIVSLMFTSESPVLVVFLVVAALISSSSFVIPAAYLVACSIAFNRLSVDSEIIAFKSLGIPTKRLTVAPIVGGVVLSIICLILNLYIVPWGYRTLKATAVQIMLKNKNYGVIPGTFSEIMDGVTVYAKSIEGDWLKDVTIYDLRDKSKSILIKAKKAKIERDLSGNLKVVLEKGKSIVVFRGGKSEILSFSKLSQTIGLGLGEFFKKATKKELTISEVLRRLRRTKKKSKRYDILIHLNKRFSLAFTPLIFCLLAIPLSITFHRESKWSSIIVSIGLFVGYYSMLSFTQNLVYEGVPAFLAVWMPNFVFGAVGCYLYLKRSDAV